LSKKLREGVIDENLIKKINNLLPENTKTPSNSNNSGSNKSKSKSKSSPGSVTKSGGSVEQGRNRRRTPSSNRMNVNNNTPLKSALSRSRSMSHDRSILGSPSASPFSSPGRPRGRRVSFANERNAGSQKQNQNANRNSTGARK
tara:strand:+ start:2752 stop:3183 length:432 start_codon:yes stop_codon:yes gene_type:complete